MSELKSLAAKMAAIMGDVPTMIKNGTNQQQRYQYVTAEDVKAAIRPLLKKHKLAVFSAMLGVERTPGTTKGGGASMTTIAHMRFTLVCGETGESMACDWFGESTDYGDKSVNKAATAAEKYWLLNTFLLSTTEPEADEETIETVAETPAAAPALMTNEQYVKINVIGKTIYGQGWPASFKKLASRHTNGRTEKAGEMTTDEAETMFDTLLAIKDAAQQEQPT